MMYFMSDYLSNLFSLDGRVALVTGGSSGIGAAIGRALAAAGARVVLLARQDGQLAAAVSAIGQAGGQAGRVCADLSDRKAIPAACARVRELFGPPDILVNAAGVNIRPTLPRLSVAEWDLSLELNLTAPFLLGQEFGPAMAGWPARPAITSPAS